MSRAIFAARDYPFAAPTNDSGCYERGRQVSGCDPSPVLCIESNRVAIEARMVVLQLELTFRKRPVGTTEQQYVGAIGHSIACLGRTRQVWQFLPTVRRTIPERIG